MSLDPKSLRLFILVIKSGTITAAAKNEHIAAAAISRRLSNLEDHLGVPLVVRSNKGIKPTAAGQALLNISHRILNDLDSIKTQMLGYATGMKGYVRIFANISAINQFLPSELSSFLSDNPLVQIDLEEHISTTIAQSIADNNADIGVLVADNPIAGVEYLPYKEDDLVVIVAKSHPLARKSSIRLEQTLGFEYVGLPPGSQLNLQLTRAAHDLGRHWRCRFQVPSYDALCLMVESNLGMGVLPRRIAASYARTLRIRMLNLNEPWAHRKLQVCIRSYDSLSTAARLLVNRMTSGEAPPHAAKSLLRTNSLPHRLL
jgi:DNA-binding transcriptional LysR family regulator